MKLYVQLMIIFMISLVGEGISSVFPLPVPASIIGLVCCFSSAVQDLALTPYQYGWQFSLGEYDHSFSASSSWYHG